MKILLLLTLFIVLSACASEPAGRQIEPPDRMREEVQNFLASRLNTPTVTGLSVRAYPNDVYFVTANVHYFDAIQKPTDVTRDFIVQFATDAQGGRYWQVSDATKERMRVLGITE